MIGVYDTLFNDMKDATSGCVDTGSPTAHGYPWFPQGSNIPTRIQMGSWDNTNSSLFSRFPDVCALVEDWNNATKNGMYMALNALNAPYADAWFMGTVIVHQPNWVVQKLIQFTGDQEYERTCRNGVWDAWIETSPRRLFQSVSDGKTKMASAISDKGVYTSPIETFDNMANNIRLIQTGRKEVRGTFYVDAVMPYQTSPNYVTPLFDFQPMIAYTDEAGAVIFDGTERWEGIDAYKNGFHTLRAIPEQVGNQWRITFRFYNALSYASAIRSDMKYVILSS